MVWADLSPVLADIPWCVVGAVATRHYMPERATADLDVAVLAADAPAVWARLEQAGFTRVGPLAIGGVSWRSPDGGYVDVLTLNQPWAAVALEEAEDNRDRQGLPVIPLPYLVLMKLEASRLQDMADLARMLGLADEAHLEQVGAAVRRWRPQDVEDLEAMIQAGRWEAGQGPR